MYDFIMCLIDLYFLFIIFNYRELEGTIGLLFFYLFIVFCPVYYRCFYFAKQKWYLRQFQEETHHEDDFIHNIRTHYYNWKVGVNLDEVRENMPVPPSIIWSLFNFLIAFGGIFALAMTIVTAESKKQTIYMILFLITAIFYFINAWIRFLIPNKIRFIREHSFLAIIILGIAIYIAYLIIQNRHIYI